MEYILNTIKKMIPKRMLNFIRPAYHKIMAQTATFWYGYPSEKMIVIGVTGTNGKSTTTELIARVLENGKPLPNPPLKGEGAYKVGFTSTVKFKVGDKEWLNDKKMTMLGRFQLQKLLRDMVKAGCKYAVVETSSEGIKQARHKGINYDYLVFTNLTPEHIESHGSFERYKEAKLELFRHLEKSRRKKLVSSIKMIIVNGDDKYADEFLDFKVDEKVVYGVGVDYIGRDEAMPCLYRAENARMDKSGTSFNLSEIYFKLNILGRFNVYNALPAIIIGEHEGMGLEEIRDALMEVKGVPGRMEFIDEGQDFSVLVDYAYEPEALGKVYETIGWMGSGNSSTSKDSRTNTPLTPLKGGTKITEFNKIIHVLGSCGGGRDKARRAVLGKIASENANIVIVTNEDPYDDDPMEIINEVARGAMGSSKFKVESSKFKVFKILDRREAIRKALELAEKDDLVLITGKGAEQAICVADGKKIAWDDRAVVKEELRKL